MCGRLNITGRKSPEIPAVQAESRPKFSACPQSCSEKWLEGRQPADWKRSARLIYDRENGRSLLRRAQCPGRGVENISPFLKKRLTAIFSVEKRALTTRLRLAGRQSTSLEPCGARLGLLKNPDHKNGSQNRRSFVPRRLILSLYRERMRSLVFFRCVTKKGFAGYGCFFGEGTLSTG